MAQRNYPCDNIIDVYFGASNFTLVGEQVFKKQLWQCMVGQALLIKQNIETRRSKNEFGIIVWQYNEIWPTGGWGSIEYGTVGYTPGQVIGGRWKPLHYWYKKTIYSDVMATCGTERGGNLLCYVNNNAPLPFKGTVSISQISFADSSEKVLKTVALDMPAGVGVTKFFELTPPGGNLNGTHVILHAVVSSSDGKVVNDNHIPLTAPKNMLLPKAEVTFSVADTADEDGTVSIKVTSTSFALYVTLTTTAQGRFSDNAFVLRKGTVTIDFIPFKGFEIDELKRTLRVEHAQSYS